MQATGAASAAAAAVAKLLVLPSRPVAMQTPSDWLLPRDAGIQMAQSAGEGEQG